MKKKYARWVEYKSLSGFNDSLQLRSGKKGMGRILTEINVKDAFQIYRAQQHWNDVFNEKGYVIYEEE